MESVQIFKSPNCVCRGIYNCPTSRYVLTNLCSCGVLMCVLVMEYLVDVTLIYVLVVECVDNDTPMF